MDQKYKPYTGIGTRELPDNRVQMIIDISKKLGEIGYTLRSGGADGADIAFEAGALKKEIYLPWQMFNGNRSTYVEATDEALNVVEKYAKEYIPKMNHMKDSVRKLYARNIHQVIGYDIDNPDPSEFLVCYAEEDEDRNIMGGTGFTVHVAKKYNVPVYNLNNVSDFQEFSTLLNKKIVVYLKTCMRHLAIFCSEEVSEDHLNVIDKLAENKWTEQSYNAAKIIYKKYRNLL